MHFYDKRQTLDEDIKPLMQEVQRIATQHSIQFCCVFQCAVKMQGQDVIDDHTSTGYVINDSDFPASARIKIMECLSKMPPNLLPEAARRLGIEL